MKTGKNNWNELLKIHFIFGVSESEGSFQYGNYRREADDLRAVVEHFHEEKHFIAAIVGHSKGIAFESHFSVILWIYTVFLLPFPPFLVL